MPSIYSPCPKGRMRIYYSLWFCRHIGLPLWMGVRDTGHQGHYHTLSLLQECFWWPGMVNQIRQSIRACTHCLQYEGGFPKAPLCPIVATAPLNLLHVDFTSIETTLEPNQLPRVAKILVFQEHFTKNMLANVTPDQTAKTVAKFLYLGYISILGTWPGSWVIEVLASLVVWFRKYARS